MAAAVVALGSSVAVWPLGAIAPVRPEVFATLLVVGGAGGLLVCLASFALERPGRARRILLLLGLSAIASSLSFPICLFQVEEGPVPVANVVASPPVRPERLRVLDFNVLLGHPDFAEQEPRFQELRSAIAGLKPDIIILQEAWHTAEHGNLAARLAAALEMNHAYARANGSLRLIGFEEGSAILSRFPIREARRQALAPTSPFWEHRIALAATLDLGDGPLTVIGVHMSGPVSGEQTAFLLGKSFAPGAGLLAGDLNVSTGSESIRRLEESGFVDVLPGGIDHVFVRVDGPWRVARAQWMFDPATMPSCSGRPYFLSDHPAIVVDLERR